MKNKPQKPRVRTRRHHAVVLKFQPLKLKLYRPPIRRKQE